MAAPAYSPTSGKGTTYTDSSGSTYIFDGTFWQQISSGSKIQSTGANTSNNFMDYYTGWNSTDAKADFNSTYGGDINKLQNARGGGGGGDTTSTGTSPLDEFVNLFAQLVGSPVTLPPLQVKSFEEYEAQALEELKPYYERILKEEGGDVEKAKARLEEDYNRGIRINREDYQTAKAGYGEQVQPGETAQQYYNRTKTMPGTFPQEGISLLDNLMKRGIQHSGIATTDTANLSSSQERRQEAIKTALQRYEEQAGITKARGLEDVNTAWERRQFELSEQEKENAATMARQKRSDEIATQEIERSNIMRKAIENIYA